MTSPTGTCAECGAALTGKRPNHLYCGDRCRQRGHRAQRRRLAGEVSAWFSDQLSTTAEPITRLSDLMSRTAAGRPGWRAQVDQLMDYRPDVAEAFGQAVLAAHAAPLPATQCRTCYSVMIAEMTGAALPIPDAATRTLLGELCPKCLGAIRAAAQQRMPPPAPHKRRSAPKARAAARASARHSAASCRTCELSEKAREALIASASPDASAAPDYELAELAGRSRTPHELQPIRGARLAGITRRHGILRTRYASWSPP